MIDVAIKKWLGSFCLDVAFSVAETRITALFGPSGAGKTSVVNLVAGLLRPDDGHISVGSRVFFDSSEGVDLPPERRRVGYVFQDGRLFPHLSVRRNLTYGMDLVPPSARYVDMDQVISLLGIGHLLARRPAKLSGGEKQRIALGRALLTSPHILLMDEPLASLDGERKAELLPFLACLPRAFGIPILYVSHSVDEVAALADTVVLLRDGRVVGQGHPQKFLPPFAEIVDGLRDPSSQ